MSRLVILNYKIIVSIVNGTAQYYKRDRIKKITSPAVTIYIIIKYKANVILRKLRYYVFNELFKLLANLGTFQKDIELSIRSLTQERIRELLSLHYLL
jgi:hypothetical protein